ncbi:hypothetical protein SDC9_191086 [bioreactor metagenome]|uniref:Uncharacterized protein n=1 Tax=bioreactor metagenome TaxID=1076179 RepID=A0A645HY51_9ZZZZ
MSFLCCIFLSITEPSIALTIESKIISALNPTAQLINTQLKPFIIKDIFLSTNSKVVIIGIKANGIKNG